MTSKVTREEIQNWWRVTTQIMISRKFASSNKHYPIWVVTRHQYGISLLVSQTSFRRETSGGVAKCRLFSQATSSETCHVILSERTKRYMYKPFWCLSSVSIFIFILQIKTVDLSNSADCLSKFKSSKWLGLLLFAGIVGGTVLKESSNSENEERKA